MQRLILFFACSLFLFTKLPGQTSQAYELFGSYVDINGRLIHNYIDQDYSSGKSMAITVNSFLEHTHGTYYPPNGIAGKGYTLYTPGDEHFSFQKDKGAAKEVIEPPLSWSFTVGADSFIVANNFPFYIEERLKDENVEEPKILEFLAKTNKFSFFKYTHTKKIYGELRTPNHLIRRAGTEELISLPLDFKSFISTASYLFQDYPELNELIQNEVLKQKEFDKIIRFIQYSDALKDQSLIYYTSSWETTERLKKCVYYAKVERIGDSWKLDFHNRQGQKIFTEHYDYKDPVTKQGVATWYYPETGGIRKERYFKKGEQDEKSQIFHPNGELHYMITVSPSGQQVFDQVFTDDGQGLLNVKGYGSETFYDQTRKRTIHREYKRHLLAASWYTNEENQKIYQLASKNSRIRSLNALNKKIGGIENYPEGDVREGIDGIVLVKILLAPDSRIESFSILKGLSPTIDKKVEGLISEISFKSGKHGKEKIYQEVILPVHFTLFGQSQNRFNYYHNNFFHMDMQRQFMQQTQMQNMKMIQQNYNNAHR